MTKPKFNTTVCFHCGVDKAVEIAKAFEQGKLATFDKLFKDLDEHKQKYEEDIFRIWVRSWLKSQLSEKKEVD